MLGPEGLNILNDFNKFSPIVDTYKINVSLKIDTFTYRLHIQYVYTKNVIQYLFMYVVYWLLNLVINICSMLNLEFNMLNGRYTKLLFT